MFFFCFLFLFFVFCFLFFVFCFLFCFLFCFVLFFGFLVFWFFCFLFFVFCFLFFVFCFLFFVFCFLFFVFCFVFGFIFVFVFVLLSLFLLFSLSKSISSKVEVMRRNNHPNIVGLLCVCNTNEGNLYLIMPLMAGNLEKYMKANASKLSLLKRLTIARQILLGLNWLHSQSPPILHLDLKMENVLYDENYQMKLTDFGLSAVLADDVGYVESRLKTPGNVGHMSPEVIQKRKFDEKADVYSMGVLFWEIMKGCEWESEVVDQLRKMRINPAGAGGLREVVKKAVCLKKLRPSLEKLDFWPDSLKELLQRMWALDAKDRPTLGEVIEREQVIRADLLEMMIGSKVNDVEGKRFWISIVMENELEDEFEEVPWGVFKKKFYSDFGLVLPKNETDRKDLDVQLLLYLKLALNAIQTEKVALGRFASVVDAFGPLNKGTGMEFLERVEETLKNRWFRPDLTQDEAKGFLLGQDEGTFVVRFSAQKGVPFTITRMKNGKVHQTRIYKVEQGLRIGELSSQKWSGVFFPSLKDIMSSPGVVRAFNLKLFPVRRYLGPGEQLVLAPLEDTNYLCDDALDGSGVLDELLDGGSSPSPSSASSSSSQYTSMFGGDVVVNNNNFH